MKFLQHMFNEFACFYFVLILRMKNMVVLNLTIVVLSPSIFE